jgi:predicted acylesterase/phospholipase RssA
LFTGIAKLFNEPAQAGRATVSFQVAVGTYDDVLEWYKTGLVDVAILSAGTVAELFSSPDWKGTLKDLYIGSHTLHQISSSDNYFAAPERRARQPQVQYHSVCLVNKDSPIKTWSDLEQYAHEEKVKYLFVHPLSVSGRILPQYVLKQKGVTLSKNLVEVEWTYDHDSTVRALEDPSDDGLQRVGFVSDETGVDKHKVRKIIIPELDQVWIPQEVVLISSNSKGRKDFIKNLLVRKVTHPDFVTVPDWAEQYEQSVVKWVNELEIKPSKMGQQFFTLEQIVGKLRGYENIHPGATRLALVLSGGGAKCAYQVGAISAIENEINAAQTAGEDNEKEVTSDVQHEGGSEPLGTDAAQASAPKPKPLDIGVVVGTSGGAINALCVALGLTRTEQGQDDLRDTWLHFSQRDFFHPWSPLPAMLGLMMGLFQALLVIIALRLCDEERIIWRRFTRTIVIVLTCVAVALYFSRWSFWASLPVIAVATVVGMQLFDSRSQIWRRTTGTALFLLGALELIAGLKDYTPWEHLYIVIPLVIFPIIGLLIILTIRLFLRSERVGWLKPSALVVSLTGAGVVLTLMWNAPREWMNQFAKNHLLHHAWLFFTMNLVLSALCLMGIGLLLLLAEVVLKAEQGEGPGWLLRAFGGAGGGPNHERASAPDGAAETGKNQAYFHPRLEVVRTVANFFINRQPILRALIIAVIALFTLQLTRSLLHDTSLSTSGGVEKAIAEKMPKLLQHCPNVPQGVTLQGSTDHQRLEDLSRKIIENKWLQRDLVITSSSLAAEDQPPDLYFYYNHSQQNLPPDKEFPPDSRFKSFAEEPFVPRLLDVVIGSASIYPVFDPRPLSLDTNGSDSLQLIDGGFAHNSPVEAAVAWGATHIILIEASPKSKPSQHMNLLDNSVDAFNYLFSEAQLVDARSRGKVEIFTLRPSPDGPGEDPNLCTFDFTDVLVKGAIDKGMTDATNVETPKFLRERGQPSF